MVNCGVHCYDEETAHIVLAFCKEQPGLFNPQLIPGYAGVHWNHSVDFEIVGSDRNDVEFNSKRELFDYHLRQHLANMDRLLENMIPTVNKVSFYYQ